MVQKCWKWETNSLIELTVTEPDVFFPHILWKYFNNQKSVGWGSGAVAGVGGIWQHSKHLCYCDSAILDKTTSRPRHQGFGRNQLQTSKFTRKRSNWVLSSWKRFSHIFCLSSHLKLETSVLWEVTWMTFTQVLHESILIHYVCYVCSHWNLAHIDFTCNGVHSQRSSSIYSIALHHI